MADDRATDDHLQTVRVAKERFADQLKANPDVHGVGVGHRRRGGEKTDEYVVVVHVLRKLPEAEVPVARLVPNELRITTEDGREVVVSTDVQERPRPAPETGGPAPGVDVSSRVRPVPGGMSAGFSGTLGGWVWDIETRRAVALSNRHVFGSMVGAGVTQPSRNDGGSLSGDRIASVLRAGALDAAIAEPLDQRLVSASILGGGPAVFEIADAVIGKKVQKTGRGTGLTRGVVELIDYDSDHNGSHSDLWIDGDGVDFSDGGDSGSLYLERDHTGRHGFPRIVGLHWGGAGNDGVGHSIRAVFEDLGLTVLPPAAMPTDRPH